MQLREFEGFHPELYLFLAIFFKKTELYFAMTKCIKSYMTSISFFFFFLFFSNWCVVVFVAKGHPTYQPIC